MLRERWRQAADEGMPLIPAFHDVALAAGIAAAESFELGQDRARWFRHRGGGQWAQAILDALKDRLGRIRDALDVLLRIAHRIMRGSEAFDQFSVFGRKRIDVAPRCFDRRQRPFPGRDHIAGWRSAHVCTTLETRKLIRHADEACEDRLCLSCGSKCRIQARTPGGFARRLANGIRRGADRLSGRTQGCAIRLHRTRQRHGLGGIVLVRRRHRRRIANCGVDATYAAAQTACPDR
jgi:hypothetical protein